MLVFKSNLNQLLYKLFYSESIGAEDSAQQFLSLFKYWHFVFVTIRGILTDCVEKKCKEMSNWTSRVFLAGIKFRNDKAMTEVKSFLDRVQSIPP